MHGAAQSGFPSSRSPSSPSPPKHVEVAQSPSIGSTGKGKKRDKPDQSIHLNRKERLSKEDGNDFNYSKYTNVMNKEATSFVGDDGGLCSLAGVEQLFSLVQQNKTVAEVICWRTFVGRAIAATRINDCLNYFLKLGGLPLLDEWLQDAYNRGKLAVTEDLKDEEKGTDELLVLLSALEKLPVDLEALEGCSVGKSVNNLRSHKNGDIQKRARKLMDAWKKRIDLEIKVSGHDEVVPGESPLDQINLKPASTGSSPDANTLKAASMSHSSVKAQTSPSISQGAWSRIVSNETGIGHNGMTEKEYSELSCADGVDSNPATKLKDPTKAEQAPLSNIGRQAVGPHLEEHKEQLCSSRNADGENPTSADLQVGKESVVDESHCSGMLDSTCQTGILEGGDNRHTEMTSRIVDVEMDSNVVDEPATKGSATLGGEAGPFSVDTNEPVKSIESKIEIHCKEVHETLQCCASSSSITEMSVASGENQEKGISPSAAKSSSFEENLLATEFKKNQDIVENRQSEGHQNDHSCPKSSAEAMNAIVQQEEHRISGSPTDRNLETGSASDVCEDDPLEVARQVAKEVEREMASLCEPACLEVEQDKHDLEYSGNRNSASKDALKLECNSSSAVKEKALSHQQVNQDSPLEGSIFVCKEGASDDVNMIQTCLDKHDECDQVSTVSKDIAKELSTVTDQNDGQFRSAPNKRELGFRPDFDLNEGAAMEEGSKESFYYALPPVFSTASSLSTPVAVVAATKGAFIPSDSLMRVKTELGWQGSAATSAFRPAEPRRPPEMQQSSGESTAGEGSSSGKQSFSSGKQSRPPLDIDLNVVDELVVTDDYEVVPPPLWNSQKSNRLDLDLNRIDDSEESTVVSASDMRAPEHSGSVKPNESNTSVTKGITRDFDLNDGPAMEEITNEETILNLETSVNPSASGFRVGGDLVGVTPWFAPANPFPAVFSIARPESSYSVTAQPFLNGAGGIPFNVDLYQTLTTPAVAYPSVPSIAYPYSGFQYSSSYPYSSSSFPPASGYMDTSASPSFSTMSSQMLVSCPPVLTAQGGMARFVRPHLMAMPETARMDNNNVWSRPSFDLNAGPDVLEGDFRDMGASLRQSATRISVEDQMKGAMPGIPMKRKEPENGRDSRELFQASIKQPTWC